MPLIAARLRTASQAAVLCWILSIPAAAQLIPVGSPVPKTALPPVVFLNGYQLSCGAGQFAGTFGSFDQFLQASGRVTFFFDNCSFSGKPSIESLGQSFGAFLAALKYTDGTPVTQVDVVGHSMGGLIIRAYLAGMQTNGTFSPPANPGIRKAVFVGTPHFGTYATSLNSLFASDIQTQELSLGSTFNFALATWNQGIDDLRGVDALSVSGNGGSIINSSGQSEGDGVSTLTSASIGFATAGRTRIVPYCHIPYTALYALAGVLAGFACPPGAPGIAVGVNSTDTNVQLILSFLNGTTAWQTLGTSPTTDPLASTNAGVIVRTKTAADQFTTMVDAAAGTNILTVTSGNAVAYNELISPGTVTVKLDQLASTSQSQQSATFSAGYTTAVTVKAGPLIAAIIPAAALVSPRNIAPGTFISIYGTGFATASTTAPSSPFPTTLGGIQVLVSGAAIPLQFVSATQINAVFPATVSGLVPVTVTSSTGQSTVNVLTQPAVPAIFTSNGTAASATNAVTGAVVLATAPLHGGDYVSLYLTGLGATAAGAGGLQYARIQPVVTVAGQVCTLQYAGLSPQFPGVDQINCQIPTGLGTNAAAPVIVTSNGRASNTATLVLQ